MKITRYMRSLFAVLALALAAIPALSFAPAREGARGKEGRNYMFGSGVISREVLENYLSRSITQAEFLAGEGFYNDGPYPDKEDDTRMLKNIGAKFIGRAVYSWDRPGNFKDPRFLAGVAAKIRELHVFDPEIVFQAAIFELVSTTVNELPVPGWVFHAFNLPTEKRNFSYDAMLNPQGIFVNHWREGASVPDIARLETRMFFYFMARQYIEAGIEAIHFGQAELMSMTDRHQGYAGWRDLLAKVRQAASVSARRGTVICDAHLPGGGIAHEGKLLFDFVSFPLRLKEIPAQPQKAELEAGYLDAIYGKTRGGITPSGWSCTQSPYLVEFDNFGISNKPGDPRQDDHYIWGYDEISWFSRQPEEYRNRFLEYAWDWVSDQPGAFLQMPGSRIITGADTNRYRANTKSEACRTGKSQEETIKKLWSR